MPRIIDNRCTGIGIFKHCACHAFFRQIKTRSPCAQSDKPRHMNMIAFGIDKALPQAIHSEMTPLFLVVGGYLFAAVATASLTYSFLKFAARTNQNVLFDLRQRLFVHAQRLKFSAQRRARADTFKALNII